MKLWIRPCQISFPRRSDSMREQTEWLLSLNALSSGTSVKTGLFSSACISLLQILDEMDIVWFRNLAKYLRDRANGQDVPYPN